jgi:hypothetical protein
MSDRNKAFELQERLEENLIGSPVLLDFLLNNWMTGADALEAMQAAVKEFLDEEEDDEDGVDGSSWRESEDFFDENN